MRLFCRQNSSTRTVQPAVYQRRPLQAVINMEAIRAALIFSLLKMPCIL